MEKSLDHKRLLAQLMESPHGDLSRYVAPGLEAATGDPDFFAHLLAWNHRKGSVRDAKVALPLLGLAAGGPRVAVENALAHTALLRPRDLTRAVSYWDHLRRGFPEVPAKPAKGKRKAVMGRAACPPVNPAPPARLWQRFITRYLREYEAKRDISVLHRHSFKALYTRFHVKPGEFAQTALFDKIGSGPFAAVRLLKDLDPVQIAATIEQHKIPYLVARGALGRRVADPDVLVALIGVMSPSELVTNMRALRKMGATLTGAARAALEEALKKVGSSTRGASLKTTRAAEALEESSTDDELDTKLAVKLKAAQERQLEQLRTVEGNWAVLVDRSGSMDRAIEVGQQVAAILARLVKGTVHLVFFNNAPRYVEATGKTYEELKQITGLMRAEGGTSIGCGLQYLLERKIAVDGIAIVSDGGENNPPTFGVLYAKYTKALNVEPTVYWYDLPGSAFPEERRAFEYHTKTAGADLQRFDLHKQVDYYSLPNVVQTMRVGRYSLLDEILAYPLLTLDEVLPRTVGMAVLPKETSSKRLAG